MSSCISWSHESCRWLTNLFLPPGSPPPQYFRFASFTLWEMLPRCPIPRLLMTSVPFLILNPLPGMPSPSPPTPPANSYSSFKTQHGCLCVQKVLLGVHSSWAECSSDSIHSRLNSAASPLILLLLRHLYVRGKAKSARKDLLVDSNLFRRDEIAVFENGLHMNKAEIDVFLELSCFFNDPADLAIWTLVPLTFLKPAWTSGISQFTYCWSLPWRILSITLLACEMSAIVQ